MAMAAQTIVSENLTLTGSIGVVQSKFNLGKLYEKIGFNSEIISKGRFVDLDVVGRPFRPDEEKLFAETAHNVYHQFRYKAASSRSMSIIILQVHKMEEIAQGRVWTGNDGASQGLVDAVGGFSRVVAIEKQKANIPHDKKVTLVELTKQKDRSLIKILFHLKNSAIVIDITLKQLQDGLASSDGVQAHMDETMLQGLDGSSIANDGLQSTYH